MKSKVLHAYRSLFVHLLAFDKYLDAFITLDVGKQR